VAQPCFTPRLAGVAHEVVKNSAIFFDRDGVLAIPTFRDGRSFAALSINEFRIYPEAEEAVLSAKTAGFLAIVITNQPDVASGKVSRETVEAMHEILQAQLALHDIEVNYEPSGSLASRRKPNPGMIFDSAEKWNLSLSTSYVVGDRASDMEAAHRAGCASVFIDRGYVAEPLPRIFDYKASDVLDAVKWCIARKNGVQDAENL
jgi:D-glycero-D-manno-heptose 1,7-bisphosphate phosphatase